jgi:DNA-binding PadR family transcriptional regulator
MRHVGKCQEDDKSQPLSEPVLLILISLADEPRHGYALIKNIEMISKGRVRLSTGTLYGALHRLLNDGWIERFEGGDTARDKQAYKLTFAGYKQLQWELERMQQLTQIAADLVKSEV